MLRLKFKSCAQFFLFSLFYFIIIIITFCFGGGDLLWGNVASFSVLPVFVVLKYLRYFLTVIHDC